MSGACNTTNEIDVIEIEVQSRTSRDVETILARETGANTGIFRSVPLPLIEMRSPVSGDGVMSASKGDVLDALSRCDGKRMTSQIEINPGSFVFNSVTNAPVSGAEVQVLDASGAMVASATTDAQGYFTLGELPAGTYRYEVLPPAAFSFPSVRLDFPGYGRNSAGQEAYGASFTHAGGHVSFTDIPVDPYYGVPLVLEKSADKDRISIGEFVTYTLRAQNNMNQALVYSQMTDRLPHGATMVPGSVQLDGEPWADPAGDGSGDYVFDLGLIHPLQTRVLTYVVRFTPLAKEGRLYNSAVLSGSQAGTGQARVSNTARTYVRMDNSGGVFARQGTILGTVFLDCDENGRQDPGVDPGIPGVTIITQEGLSVVTDINGKYSLFGMRPVSHVLAVQASTLPKDTAARVTQVSDMLQAGSRMVSLKRGGLMAENFAIGGCSVATRHAVGHRVSTFLERNPGGAPIAADLPMDPAVAGPRSARSEAGLATTTQIARASLDGGAEQSGDLAAKAQKAAEAKATLESIVRTLTPEPAFLNVQDNARAARKSLSVRVKGPADLKLRLELNGTEIGESQIGEKTVWAGGNVQALEFVALRLVAGENRLALIGIGPFGNERARKEVTVIAAGDPEKIEIIAPKSARATPGTPVPVIVRFLDGQGRPVQASGNVTLHAGNSRWDVRDNRSDQPGVQAYIDNGEATFGLLPSQVAGPDTITVQSGYGRAEAKILFTPDLDQRIMVGIIEGSVALKGGAELIDHQDLSAFEDTTTGLRGELYLKGRIRGDALLTLRYSSDRDTDDRMFRDIRGDEYYPVYGDNSERGFDAQSSSNLFVKIEKGASYVLYGDIAIEPEARAFKLGGFRSVTTGAKAHWQGDKTSVTVFAARTNQRQHVIEFAGLGISGPYDVDLTHFRAGTDRVSILVRDEDSGEILSEKSLRRSTDYILDYFRNTIIFDAPVAQADSEGNPVSVRIAYETENEEGEKFWLYGGEVNYQLTDKTSVGVRAIHSDGAAGSEDRRRIYAAQIETQLDEYTVLQAEVATTTDGNGVAGTAARVSIEGKNDVARYKLEASHTDATFAPPGSSYRPGTDRIAFEVSGKFNENAGLSASASYVANSIAGTKVVTGDITFNRRVNDHFSTKTGLRFSHDLVATSNQTKLGLVTGATIRSKRFEGLTFKSEIETPLYGVGAGRIELGAEYELGEGHRLTASTQFTFENGSTRPKVGLTKIGYEYYMTEWLTGRTEITTSGGGLSDTRMVQGVAANWDLTKNLRVSMNGEHTLNLGNSGEEVTSIALGAKWGSDDGRWVADADLDATFKKDGRSFYANLGVAGKVSDSITLLGRSRYAVDQTYGGMDRRRHRLRVGAAYRPLDDPRFKSLIWYERRLDRATQSTKEDLWSIAGTWSPSERLRINGKYAGHRRVFDADVSSSDGTFSGVTQLLQAGVTFDAIPKRLELGLNAYRMWDSSGFATNALGAEVGYVFDEGVMVSVGYNKAIDQAPHFGSLYQDGLYIRVRIKLDEPLWDTLDKFLGD